jgi:hypothetical protein
VEDSLQHTVKSDCEYAAEKPATYSLRFLDVYMPPSAREKPERGIFKTEFSFERGAAASAVIHTCISANDRQSAHGWLFASSAPDLHHDRPVAELAITSTGDVSLQAGCPTDYDVLRDRVGLSLCRIEAPPSEAHRWLAQHGRWLRGSIVPMALLVAAAPSIIFFTQKTPSERLQAYEAAKNAMPRLIVAQMPSLFGAIPSRPLRALQADPAYRDSYRDDSAFTGGRAADSTRTTPSETGTSIPSTIDDDPASGKLGRSVPGTATASPESNVHRSGRTPHSAAASARVRPSKLAEARQARAELSIPQAAGAGATSAPEAILEEPRAAPREQLALNTSGADQLTARQQERCATGGIFAQEICRERLRWSHCHPDKWDRVPECRVRQVAPSE